LIKKISDLWELRVSVVIINPERKAPVVKAPDRQGKLTRVTVEGNIQRMGKLRRGGYIFVWWKGDHPPKHVHIYRDETLVVKWDLDDHKAMKGDAPGRVLALIEELKSEGLL
jgi:hypothetical protein